MAANLKGRLSRLRELGLVKAADLPPVSGTKAAALPASGGSSSLPNLRRPDCEVPSFLAGWERRDDLLWARELRFAGRLPESLDLAPFIIRHGAAEKGIPALAETVRSEELRFFDLETTGLSGGTGTVAFLAAIGREDGEGFAVRQLFLEDYPGERTFLEALLSELVGGIVVTYNGKAFDLPLLRTRCVMNAIAPPEPRDVDALYCSRRLWRRVHGGASLSLLERAVLDVEREEDVPGSMIPDIWFEYLRRSDHPLMRAVLAHNASDVASLAALTARAARAFAEPRALAALASVDRSGLGRGLITLGRAVEGEELLEAAAGDGDERAGLFLSRRYRREGRIEDRRRVLGMLPSTYASCVERAKFHEHSSRDVETALMWARKAELLDERDASALEARIARLERKARKPKR